MAFEINSSNSVPVQSAQESSCVLKCNDLTYRISDLQLKKFPYFSVTGFKAITEYKFDEMSPPSFYALCAFLSANPHKMEMITPTTVGILLKYAHLLGLSELVDAIKSFCNSEGIALTYANQEWMIEIQEQTSLTEPTLNALQDWNAVAVITMNKALPYLQSILKKTNQEVACEGITLHQDEDNLYIDITAFDMVSKYFLDSLTKAPKKIVLIPSQIDSHYAAFEQYLSKHPEINLECHLDDKRGIKTAADFNKLICLPSFKALLDRASSLTIDFKQNVWCSHLPLVCAIVSLAKNLEFLTLHHLQMTQAGVDDLQCSAPKLHMVRMFASEIPESIVFPKHWTLQTS